MSSLHPDLARRFEEARNRALAALQAERSSSGHWTGELSASALSTATAVTALAISARHEPALTPRFEPLIAGGMKWLAKHQNTDGGWGDTTRSLSNISTTALGWAAFGAVEGADLRHEQTVASAEQWLNRHAGGPGPDRLAEAIIARYGKDRTFSVPILTMCALAGRLGSGPEAWDRVLPLPFELAALPQQFYAALRLPDVSKALPALIAIGQARHRHRPSRNPVVRIIRSIAQNRTLSVLTAIQPGNGGFLEATPLTSFVTMSLAGSGRVAHPVVRRGLDFLCASVRPDGSWPIDTNLATWVTTLSINALGGRLERLLTESERITLKQWLLAQQYTREHPYTHAAPGGWAWTDLPGGVPDADDTAGALLALRRLGPVDDRTLTAALAGIRWLLNLQNRDGGVPTFCKGWGTLPFDRSGADLTAHALRTWLAWRDHLPRPEQHRIDKASRAAIAFLHGAQRSDGSWLPLWFGNQFGHDDENPVYGTARVTPALVDAVGRGFAEGKPALERGVAWLLGAQNPDGSWGRGDYQTGTVEETALSVEALAQCHAQSQPPFPVAKPAGVDDAIQRGCGWLAERIEDDSWKEPAPIGFYFAKLWYYEKLYPIIFGAGAMEAVTCLQPAMKLWDNEPGRGAC